MIGARSIQIGEANKVLSFGGVGSHFYNNLVIYDFESDTWYESDSS